MKPEIRGSMVIREKVKALVSRRYFSTGVVMFGVLLLAMITSCATDDSAMAINDENDVLYPRHLVGMSFESLHSPVAGSEMEYLFLGAFPVEEPSAALSPELAVFSGRWQGYQEGTPVAEDIKIVLVIQEVTEEGGRLIQSLYFDPQAPVLVDECRFYPVEGQPGVFSFNAVAKTESADVPVTFTFWLEQGGRVLKGRGVWPGGRVDNFTLTPGAEVVVYRDLERHLASRGIQVRRFGNSEIVQLSDEYLVYLPEDYEADGETRWPLILFFHGMGDIGQDPMVMRKASPFRMILEKGGLPVIIAAPQLNYYGNPPEFRVAFMEAVLDEVRETYAVDPNRVYVTGLSLGGHAAWRLAMARPDEIAALVPIAAADPAFNLQAKLEGWTAFAGYENITDIPVRVYHGAKDTVIKPEYARKTFEAFISAGGSGEFFLYDSADHDSWTETYLNPEFYSWLLSQSRGD